MLHEASGEVNEMMPEDDLESLDEDDNAAEAFAELDEAGEEKSDSGR